MAQNAQRPACVIPTLHANVPDRLEYVDSTCYAGGYLTQVNAGWRNVRPVIDAQACVGCLNCYLYCPDGAIFKTAPAQGSRAKTGVAVDLDFCKGCGVCARECTFGAIAMRNEAAALEAEEGQR